MRLSKKFLIFISFVNATNRCTMFSSPQPTILNNYRMKPQYFFYFPTFYGLKINKISIYLIHNQICLSLAHQ